MQVFKGNQNILLTILFFTFDDEVKVSVIDIQRVTEDIIFLKGYMDAKV